MTRTAIPKSVRDLLKHVWTLDPYNAFDSVFDDDRERQLCPSYYTINPKYTKKEEMGPNFSYKEAIELEKNTWKGHAGLDKSNIIVVNEHAVHALEDFCRDVYVAWEIYQTKLSKIP